MASGSKKVVIAALVGNGLIAVTKYGAAAFTGSSAMFSEAVHSTVDTGNQALLLYGMKRASRPPDRKHPFGYAPEIYFWAFVVAILIFATGAGVSIYEGVQKIRHPEPITSPHVNYIVLGLAIVFEGVAWTIAFREFRKTAVHASYLASLRASKDPAIFTVLLEDTAAMLGLIVALVGVVLAELLDLPVLDGVASVIIGVILAAIAIFLAYETKALLIGEAAAPGVVTSVRRLVGAEEGIRRINEVLTMHLGPNDILLNLSVDFQPTLTADQVERTITQLEKAIQAEHPDITRVFIEAERWRPGALPPAPAGAETA